MSDLLPYLVAGAVTGSLYALAATGLVLTYKTSGIFNFAHGAVGAAAAYVFYDLRDLHGLPGAVALLLSAFVFAPLLGLAVAGVSAKLATASTAHRVVATVGLLLVLQGAVQLRYGAPTLPINSVFSTVTFEVFGVNVDYGQLSTAAISMAGVVMLAALFRFTRAGLQMRAVVDNANLLDMTGGNPAQMRAVSWVIGAAFAGLSGILLSFAVGLNAPLLTLVVVQAFGAAAIGRFQNVTLTYVGGLAIGIAAAVIDSPTVHNGLPILDSVPALGQSLPFLVLFAVLIFTRRGRFTDRAFRRAPRAPIVLPAPLKTGLLAVAAIGTVLVPTVFSTRLPVFTLAAIFVIIYASLFLLMEVAGLVSLCHVAFVAIGATTFSHLTHGLGLPWLVGVLGAMAVTIPVGAVVAIPAIRLSGLYLALATFGFGVLVEQLFYNSGIMFGALRQRFGARPAVFGLDGDRGYFYLCAGAAVLAIAVILLVRRIQLGSFLDALSDSPLALATNGANVSLTWVLVFCLSAAMAGAGGALYVGVVGSVSSSGLSLTALTSFNSLLWLAVLAFAGRQPVVSPVIAALLLAVAPSYLASPNTAQWLTIAFGATALAVSTASPEISRNLVRALPRAARRQVAGPVRSRMLPTSSLTEAANAG
ncbi:MAG TPA: ABC transporter permease [Acidimicrobiia bacterium]|nr:ABC transporter permease [Acidimicrobiia bacterium]